MKIVVIIGVLLVAGLVMDPRNRAAPAKTAAELMLERKVAEATCADPAACAKANRQAYADLERRERERLLVAVVRQTVRTSLREPSSGIFGDTFFSRKAGEAVCGSVNAKNGFGGYTGMLPFVVAMPKGAVLIDDARAWNKHCAGAAVD